MGMPGLEDPERAVAAQARLERLQRTCGGLLKPEARFTDLSDAHMGAAQQTLYDLTGTDALRAPPQCAAQHGQHHDQQCAWSPSHDCVSPQGLFATQEVHMRLRRRRQRWQRRRSCERRSSRQQRQHRRHRRHRRHRWHVHVLRRRHRECQGPMHGPCIRTRLFDPHQCQCHHKICSLPLEMHFKRQPI